jgi:uncharacterized protein
MRDAELHEPKLKALLKALRRMESALLAYSGGVDSSFLLKALSMAGIPAMAVTARSAATPQADLADALRLAAELGVAHRVIDSRETEDENFLRNHPDRCFHCKNELFGTLRRLAGEEGYAVVLDGSTLEDAQDYRPGREAARRHGVRSPLLECGFRKAEIRAASRALGLDTWQKPASPCLSSRFPYGRRITPEALRRVEKAEEFLRTRGLRELRVRDHGETARIEVPAGDMEKLLSLREEVVHHLTGLGYSFVALDLGGFRSGNLNRTLR